MQGEQVKRMQGEQVKRGRKREREGGGGPSHEGARRRHPLSMTDAPGICKRSRRRGVVRGALGGWVPQENRVRHAREGGSPPAQIRSAAGSANP